MLRSRSSMVCKSVRRHHATTSLAVAICAPQTLSKQSFWLNSFPEQQKPNLEVKRQRNRQTYRTLTDTKEAQHFSFKLHLESQI